MESAFSKYIIMEVTGRIKVLGAVQQVSASFKKRELVVTTEEQYPQHIIIEFTQEKGDLLNNYNIGEMVKVSIDLGGREWVNPQGEVKYFNSVRGWRVERLAANAPAGAPQQAAPPMPAAQVFAPAAAVNEEEHDDLPF
jgi:Domain of unknown function (DUF3127)